MRERYDLDGTNEARDLGGSSNLNLLVAAGGGRYVARVYRPYVTASRLDAIQRVRRELANGGVPSAEVVPTRDGEPWTVIDGRLVEVEGFVEIPDGVIVVLQVLVDPAAPTVGVRQLWVEQDGLVVVLDRFVQLRFLVPGLDDTCVHCSPP